MSNNSRPLGAAAALLATLAAGVIVASIPSAQAQVPGQEPGIYVAIDGALAMVSSSLVEGAKPAGMMANAASFGFKGVDIKVSIDGPTSALRIDAATPEFLFRGDTFKPGDYVLVRVESKGGRRELKTGKVGMFGRVTSGVDKDALVKVKFTKKEEGLWAVVPEGALKSGEYAFVLAAAVPERVWSFGRD